MRIDELPLSYCRDINRGQGSEEPIKNEPNELLTWWPRQMQIGELDSSKIHVASILL
jgi:hypothetical protein